MQWLISPRDDLLWVIGSVVVAWAMFAAWYGQLLSTASVILIWVFVFHGPHFWATLSRTYADREQYRRRRKLFNQSLVWYAVGPITVGLGLLLQLTTGRRELVQLFFFLAAVWAFHHVAKQHFGFLALYRAKHAEFNRKDFLFHKYYLLVSLWMPALIMLGTDYHWLEGVPFMLNYALTGSAAQANIVQTGALLRDVCTFVFWGAQVAFAGSMVWRIASGRGLNLPILLLVLCCVPLTWVVIMVSMTSPISNAAFILVPVLTTYHNIQYHGLVWHYNRTKYVRQRAAPGAGQRLGWALTCNRNFFVYAGFGLLYTGATIGIEHYGVAAAVASSQPLSDMMKAFFWGFAFHHYYLDSKIWRASEDAELRSVLGFPAKRKPIAPRPEVAARLPEPRPAHQNGTSTTAPVAPVPHRQGPIEAFERP